MPFTLDEYDWELHNPPRNPATMHSSFGCPMDWERTNVEDYDLDLGPTRDDELVWHYSFRKDNGQYRAGLVITNHEGWVTRDRVTWEK